MDLLLSEEYKVGECPDCGKPLMAFLCCGKEIRKSCECEIVRQEQEEQMRKAAAIEKRLVELKNHSNIPPKFNNSTLEHFEPREGTKKALDAAGKYVRQYRPDICGLLLIGTTGSGKTHLACAIGNALLCKGVNVKFARAADIPYDVQKTYNNSDMSEADVIEPLRKASLLIIDDLGADKMSDFDRGVIQSLVDYRINYERPTIVTTNLNEKEMAAVLDSRTVDRLFGACRVFTMTAPSYRRFRKEHQT